MKVFFSKYQALGNHYIHINLYENPHLIEKIIPEISKLCDSHFGIGADGIIFVLPGEKASIKMRMFNKDGSEAEMCGNGIRQFFLFIKEKEIVPIKDNILLVETKKDLKTIKEIAPFNFTVDMGKFSLVAKQIPTAIHEEKNNICFHLFEIEGKNYESYSISMGNPHCVIFLDKQEDLENLDIQKIGPSIENSHLFPQKVNVEFIYVEDKTKIHMRVWERGTGETLACGTGACASTVISFLLEKTLSNVYVHLLGGTLKVSVHPDQKVFLTGNAFRVYDGSFNLPLPF